MVRAKYTCIGKNQEFEDTFDICFSPVTGGSQENDSFWKWTPYGEIQLGTINKAASDQFKVGKEYYVDFTLAE